MSIDRLHNFRLVQAYTPAENGRQINPQMWLPEESAIPVGPDRGGLLRRRYRPVKQPCGAQVRQDDADSGPRDKGQTAAEPAPGPCRQSAGH